MKLKGYGRISPGTGYCVITAFLAVRAVTEIFPRNLEMSKASLILLAVILLIAVTAGVLCGNKLWKIIKGFCEKRFQNGERIAEISELVLVLAVFAVMMIFRI